MLLTSKLVLARPWLRASQAFVTMMVVTLAGVALAQGAANAGADTTPSPPLTHQEGLALAKARACLGCHQVDNKRVGPSFAAIAQRYAGQDNAIPYLVQIIRKGGRGQWGAVPMPGQAVNEQDAEKLAKWIISIRK